MAGLDPSPGMLKLCIRKLQAAGLGESVELLPGTAESLPFKKQSLDIVTTSFGIRNFPNPRAALREFFRVLKPGGRVIVLELTVPNAPLLRGLYGFYFRRLLPLLGGWLFNEHRAYHYLHQSVDQFPQGRAFCAWLAEAGFENVSLRTLACGIATLYGGDRPAGARR